MMKLPPLIFHITLWRPWVLAVSPFALLAVVGVVISLATGQFAAIRGVLLVFTLGAVVVLLPIGLAVQMSRWHVDSNGIGGRNNWLVYHYLKWSEIDSVNPWLLPGYRYLQVNGSGKRWVFWLPLFFTDMPGFRSAIAQYAPPDNPLRLYLEQHPD